MNLELKIAGFGDYAARPTAKPHDEIKAFSAPSSSAAC